MLAGDFRQQVAVPSEEASAHCSGRCVYRSTTDKGKTLDRGLWVTWYDLPEAGRDAHLAWLHGTYIPKMLKKPGVKWAAHYKTDDNFPPLHRLRHTDDPSVPTGNGYIIMFGGEHAHVFAGFTPFRNDARGSAKDQEMLAMRQGARTAIFTEEARGEGRDAKKRDRRDSPAPCIQIGSYNADVKDEDELLSWYAHFRFLAVSKLPSAIAIRKYVSASGWAKHGVMYEFTSIEDRDRQFRSNEAKDVKTHAWTTELIPRLLHAPGSPNVAQRIWPPVKSAAAKKKSAAKPAKKPAKKAAKRR